MKKLVLLTTAFVALAACGAVAIAATSGPEGPQGLRGKPAVKALEQSISINWQNNRPRGRSSATFVAPGIGHGQVVCTPDTQWVRFFPYDRETDVEMWAAISRRDQVGVRAAARRSHSYGPDFQLGFNEVNGTEPYAQGSMTGIISSRGPLGRSPDKAPPVPTTFRISWHWDFGTTEYRRCYVAGTVLSKGPS